MRGVVGKHPFTNVVKSPRGPTPGRYALHRGCNEAHYTGEAKKLTVFNHISMKTLRRTQPHLTLMTQNNELRKLRV